MKCHSPPRMNPSDFGDLFTFPPVSPGGQTRHLFSEISLHLLHGLAQNVCNNVHGSQMTYPNVVWYVIKYRRSCFPQDTSCWYLDFSFSTKMRRTFMLYTNKSQQLFNRFFPWNFVQTFMVPRGSTLLTLTIPWLFFKSNREVEMCVCPSNISTTVGWIADILFKQSWSPEDKPHSLRWFLAFSCCTTYRLFLVHIKMSEQLWDCHSIVYRHLYFPRNKYSPDVCFSASVLNIFVFIETLQLLDGLPWIFEQRVMIPRGWLITLSFLRRKIKIQGSSSSETLDYGQILWQLGILPLAIATFTAN